MTEMPKKLEAALKLVPLRNWLKKQDPETEYVYGDQQNCLLAQYVRAKGYNVRRMGATRFQLADGTEYPLSGDLDMVAQGGLLDFGTAFLPRKFGQALAVAEALLKKEP